MAVTKILPRNSGLKQAIAYVLDGDKTDGHILTPISTAILVGNMNRW